MPDKITKERLHALLKKASEAMKVGEDPFHTSFLSENEVTLHEAYDLSETMAMIVGGYLNLPRDQQLKVMLAYGLEGTGIPFAMVDEHIDREKILKRLALVSGRVARKIKKS